MKLSLENGGFKEEKSDVEGLNNNDLLLTDSSESKMKKKFGVVDTFNEMMYWFLAILAGCQFIVIDLISPQIGKHHWDYSWHERNSHNLSKEQENEYRILRARVYLSTAFEWFTSGTGFVFATVIILCVGYVKFKRYGTDNGEEG